MTPELQKTLDIAPVEPAHYPVVAGPTEDQDDYEYARSNLVDFIEKGKIAVDEALRIMQMTEHPRSVEVLSGLIKNMADINKQLLDLKKANKELKEPAKGTGPSAQPTTQNIQNAVFVGTLADLGKTLEGNVIDGKV